MLWDAGVRSARTIVEATAQKVKDDGSDKFRQLVTTAMGGVLFIDEAYDLDPVNDSQGKPIVNELLTLCENDRDKISVILAGYEDDFQKKFFAYNDGLKSRFKEVMFEDFDETELATLWTGMRAKKHWTEEDNVCLVAVRRIAKGSGKRGFGNAREVRKRLEDATKSALSRLGEHFSQDEMVLKIEDVIGEDPRLSSEKLQKVLKEINEKVGWTRIKEKVQELIDLCGTNYHLELVGKPQFPIFLNRMFLGPPGMFIFSLRIKGGVILSKIPHLLPYRRNRENYRSETLRAPVERIRLSLEWRRPCENCFRFCRAIYWAIPEADKSNSRASPWKSSYH